MNSSASLLIAVFVWSWCALAVPTDGARELNASSPILPACALPCFYQAQSSTPCPYENQTCVCGNLDLQITIQACSRSTCSIVESLEAHNYLDNVCGEPDRDFGSSIRALCWLGAFLAGLFVLVRILSKITLHGSSSGPTLSLLTADDYVLILTYVLSIPAYVMVGGILAEAGLGRDVWTLESGKIDQIGFWLYIFEPDYILIMTMLKTSFILFYLRIFCRGQSDRTCCRGFLRLKPVLWATFAANIACGISFMLVLLLQCHPVSYTWTRWPGGDVNHTGGTCIDVKAAVWANGGLSVGFDAWILYLPLSQIRSMSLPLRKKIYVGMMFCVGAFVSVVSILRLQSLNSYGNTVVDPTWDYYPSAIWSVLEFTVGIICACLPACRVALLRSFPQEAQSERRLTNRASKLSQLSKFSEHIKSRGVWFTPAAAPAAVLSTVKDTGVIAQTNNTQSQVDDVCELDTLERSRTMSDVEERPALLRRESTFQAIKELTPISEALKEAMDDPSRMSMELSPLKEEFTEVLRVESVASQVDTSLPATPSSPGGSIFGGGARRPSEVMKKRRITPDFFVVPALAGSMTGSSWRTSVTATAAKRGRGASISSRATPPPPPLLLKGVDWDKPASKDSTTELDDPKQLSPRHRSGSVQSDMEPRRGSIKE